MEYFLEKTDFPSKRAKEIVFEKLNTPVLYEESGKPYTDKAYISISHSRDRVLVGICPSPIGVDIEFLRFYDLRLIDRYFSKEEKAFIKCDEDFFKVWTVKEAYLKLTGQGLTGIKKLNVVKDGRLFIEGCTVTVKKEEDCIFAIVYERI